MPELIENLTVDELKRVFDGFLDKAVPPDQTLRGRIWDAFIAEIRAECTIVEVE